MQCWAPSITLSYLLKFAVEYIFVLYFHLIKCKHLLACVICFFLLTILFCSYSQFGSCGALTPLGRKNFQVLVLVYWKIYNWTKPKVNCKNVYITRRIFIDKRRYILYLWFSCYPYMVYGVGVKILQHQLGCVGAIQGLVVGELLGKSRLRDKIKIIYRLSFSNPVGNDLSP